MDNLRAVEGKLLQHLAQDLVQLGGVQNGGGAPLFPLPAVLLALPYLLVPALIAIQCTVVGQLVDPTDNLTAVGIAVLVARPVLCALLGRPPAQNHVGLVPKLLRDDGRDVLFVPVHHPLVLWEVFNGIQLVVDLAALPPAVPALVLGVAQNAPDGAEGKVVPPGVLIALTGQPGGDGPDAQPLVGVEVEDGTDNLRLVLLDDQPAFLLLIALAGGGGN